MTRPFLSPVLAALSLVAVVVSGCVDEPGNGFPAEWRAPIVNGTREPNEPWVVMLYHDSGGGCTASVVGPRVAITARHCVRANEGSGSYLPASGFHVYVGPGIGSFVREYQVTETRSTDGYSIDNADFAVLILNQDFEYGYQRWEFTPWPGFLAGARITAIGYGQTQYDNPESAGDKYRRDGTVQAIGPFPEYGLGDREFVSQGENTCQGDSGGPLVYDGTVVGVVSRGEDGCTGLGWMTRVSGFADMVRQALRDTGACVPAGFEVCNGLDDDCANGADDGLGASCPCAGGSGASPEVCDGADNDCNGVVDDIPGCGCTGGAPQTAEVCDGIDNDCNGQADEVCQHLGQACSGNEQCSTGLCLDSVCTAYCSVAVPCIEGGICDGPPCGEGLCRLPSGSQAIGSRCSSPGQCATGFCAPTRDGSSVCARPCVPDRLDCFANEVCSTIVGGCGACLLAREWSPPRWFGEPCGADGDCLSSMCLLDGDAASCGDECAYRYCTGPCSADVFCPSGGHCRDGVCVRGPFSEPGDTCMTAGDCPGGACLSLFGVPRCVLGCPADGVCGANFTCREGVCWPDLLYPGDVCAEGQDGFCMGGICDWVGDERLCLEACTAARQCASGLACMPYASRTAGVCVPLRYAATGESIGGDEGPRGCECAASPGSPPAGRWPALAALAATVLAVLRRLRRG